MPLSAAPMVAAWGIASGLALIVLGSLALMGGRSRPRGAMAFGLFAVAWGFQVGFGNAAIAETDATVGGAMILLFLAFLLPQPYLLVEFAAAQVEGGRAGPLWNRLRLATLAAAALTVVLLVVRPTLVLEALTTRPSGAVGAQWGPLYLVLVHVPLWVAFGAALLALESARVRAPTPRTRARAAVLQAGLGLYVAFAAGNNLAFYGGWAAFIGATWENVTFALLFFALAAAVAFAGVRAFVLSRWAPTGRERTTDARLAAVLLVPLVIGAVEGALSLRVLPAAFETVGLWRLAGVAVIAYGIARLRVFDAPDRLRRVAASTTGAATAAGSGAVAFGVTSVVTAGVAMPAVVGIVATAAVFAPGLKLARRLFSVPAPTAVAEDGAYGKRLDAYRAALESALARGSLESDHGFLEALKQRFTITDDEERVLLYYARNSVLLPARGDADGAYERLRLLGEGGAGRTYLARDRARDRLVVLKEPLGHHQREPVLVEALRREARLLAKVRHPNVVRIEEVAHSHGVPVLVMEYVDGGSLADRLTQRQTLAWPEAVGIVRDVLNGLHAVHAAGVVHRDVKPANILIGRDGSARIADFGIAVPDRRTTMVEGGPGRAGTLAYMAPEVLHGVSTGDVRSDLYACGAVLHEALVGDAPRPGVPELATANVPPALMAVLSTALAPEPDDRYQDARAFAAALDRVRAP